MPEWWTRMCWAYAFMLVWSVALTIVYWGEFTGGLNMGLFWFWVTSLSYQAERYWRQQSSLTRDEIIDIQDRTICVQRDHIKQLRAQLNDQR